MLRTVAATRYVTPLREGGSLPGLVEADDDGMYVLKFRGAGQGVKALVAEVIAGKLALALGLPVPEMVFVDVHPALGRSEPDPEINDLITGSPGLNFGMDFLPRALDYNPALPRAVDGEFASKVVWFDALMTNVDRTARNPNLLIWHGRPWLIDHGATLYRHHAERDLAERAREPFPAIRDHVLLPLAGRLSAVDEALAARLGQAEIESAIAEVPDEWLAARGHEPRRDEPGLAAATAAGTARATYARYLLDRLRAPREFVREAEAARAA